MAEFTNFICNLATAHEVSKTTIILMEYKVWYSYNLNLRELNDIYNKVIK
ncbi:hypothetical protein MA16_Dca026465 [Dendrobium catenatum]|uniref:Uncharacterized protein n=1 Tax=Dendrobium catenatum TaxID=906689 RepID=A0A2I0VY62_9ASPA|nr:hypothetical protein MA16_Dca026465 [Dendrobium catenatum]